MGSEGYRPVPQQKQMQLALGRGSSRSRAKIAVVTAGLRESSSHTLPPEAWQARWPSFLKEPKGTLEKCHPVTIYDLIQILIQAH